MRGINKNYVFEFRHKLGICKFHQILIIFYFLYGDRSKILYYGKSKFLLSKIEIDFFATVELLKLIT